MPFYFFNHNCQSNSYAIEFGLCDDPPPSMAPAYIDEQYSSKWIAMVHNPSEKEVDFFGIDNCVDIRRPDGTPESRCDGMLYFENNLTFVELKMRGGGNWLSKARNQLTITINKFQEVNNLSDFDKVEDYVANGLRPFANQGNNSELQKFKTETGITLYAQKDIFI